MITWKRSSFQEPTDTLALQGSWLDQRKLQPMDTNKLADYIGLGKAVPEIYFRKYADPLNLKT